MLPFAQYAGRCLPVVTGSEICDDYIVGVFLRVRNDDPKMCGYSLAIIGGADEGRSKL